MLSERKMTLDERITAYKEREKSFTLVQRASAFEVPMQIDELLNALIADREQLRFSLRGIFNLIEDGILVRDTSKDNEDGWSIKALNLAMKLKKVYELLNPTEERKES